MVRLTGWTAKRAGGRITVHGVNAATGRPLKIVGVDVIEAGTPPIAIGKDGVQYELA